MANKNIKMSSELDKIEKQILLDKYTTAQHKAKFINEIKSGLGNEIKQVGGKVKIIEKSFLNKILDKLKKIFTKF